MAEDSIRQPSVIPPAAPPGSPAAPPVPTPAAGALGVGLEAVQDSPEFQELRRRYRRFAFPMTVVFLSWYLLYVVASGFARDFMAQKVIGNINVAIIFGLLQFVSTFLIAALYTWYANRRLDPLAEKLRKEIQV